MRESRRLGEMKNIISCPLERPQTCEMSLLKRLDNVLPFFLCRNKGKSVKEVIIIKTFSFHKNIVVYTLLKSYSIYESLCP